MSRTYRSKWRGRFGEMDTGTWRDCADKSTGAPGRKHKQPLRRAERRTTRQKLRERNQIEPRSKRWGFMRMMWW